MSNHTYQFTSESVSAGHPDKVADQISDAILDAYLAQDPNAKVACECLITTQKLLIAGEVTSTASVDAVAIAQEVLD
jgi:S-adenosylmethionine synthetase